MVYQFFTSSYIKSFKSGNLNWSLKFPLSKILDFRVLTKKYLYGNSEFFDDEIFSFQSSEDFVKYLIFSK